MRQARGRGLVTGAVLLVTAAGTLGCALVAAAFLAPLAAKPGFDKHFVLLYEKDGAKATAARRGSKP